MGKSEGAKQFPSLDSLMAYFHQDCAMYGGRLEDVVNEFKKDTAAYPEMARGVIDDIQRFIVHRPDDKQLGSDFERMLNPDVMAEGWYPEITNWRQWLTRVTELLG